MKYLFPPIHREQLRYKEIGEFSADTKWARIEQERRLWSLQAQLELSATLPCSQEKHHANFRRKESR